MLVLLSSRIDSYLCDNCNLADKFDPGSNLGITINCPKKCTLFNKEFNSSYSLNFQNLVGIDRDDFTLSILSYNLSTSFDKIPIPLTFDFRFGLSSADLDNDSQDGTYLFLGVSTTYQLPFEKTDLALSIDLGNSINSDNVFSPYGLSLVYGKNFSCSK